MAEDMKTEVIGVFPNKIRIAVKDIKDFKISEEKLAVGSYLRISDSDDCAIMAIIDNFSIELPDSTKESISNNEKKYIIEATPIGFLDEKGKFSRGGHKIAIPPIGAKPAKKDEIQNIYKQIEPSKQFCFSKLSQDELIDVPVDGDKFFNKHIAIVGSTGSGKSHTVAKLLQQAVSAKADGYVGLNNSHILIFDLHGEYKQAFPEGNHLEVNNLALPYWLMNGDELEELFVESGDHQAYNQTSLLSRIITRNKQKTNNDNDVTFDTPVQFSIKEVLNCLINLSAETRNAKKNSEIAFKGYGYKEFDSDDTKFDHYFITIYEFEEQKNSYVKKGTYNDGSLEKFISRIKKKTTDKRLDFLINDSQCEKEFDEVIRQILGYVFKKESNITVIDLSGVPFEVLSITVSLISRVIFEYGYYYKRFLKDSDIKTPILVVYEEAHQYVPKNSSAKHKSARAAIERIAKEGRKYGVTLAIVSQRPSEISETIFSQCNNFIAMRLTNPEDQNYVKRLLPDNLGPLTDSLPVLQSGEAILIGDSIIMPSLVKIDKCSPEPSSNDIPYMEEWKKKWADVDFSKLIENWTEK